MIKLLLSLSVLCVVTTGQRIMTIQLDGIQYYISRMNPYSPELNYYLAYQYCRSLGLQLASFDTKEKYESMSKYLTNAKFNNYDFWTSGNRLGTGMFLWMSTGLPFNSTFNFFENDQPRDGLMDPLDQNGNTSPQRTARDDRNRPVDNNCVLLKAPTLMWAPDDCLQIKDFICEQTRCYYYNYGSIPVSASQGRPIISTTTTEAPMSLKESTALYISLMGSTKAPLRTLSDENVEEDEHAEHSDETTTESVHEEDEDEDDEDHHDTHTASSEDLEGHTEHNVLFDERINEEEDIPVEQKLRQLTDNIQNLDKISSNDDETRQSFLSLSDLIKTLRPDEQKPLQIDSSYSRSQVLGEKPDVVYHPRNTGDVANRSLFK